MLGIEPLRDHLARMRHGRVRAGFPSLAYLFVAQFADGHLIGQTQDDLGLLPDPRKGGATGSAFTDVEVYATISPVVAFALFGIDGPRDCYGVDLRDGTLIHQGERRPLDPVQWMQTWGFHRPDRFRLIYARTVVRHQHVGDVTGRVYGGDCTIAGFTVGWEATVNGQDYHAVIQLVRDPTGRYHPLP